MKARIIFLVMIMLAGSRLAYAQYHIEFDSEADRVMHLEGDTIRGNFCTRAEAEAYQSSRSSYEQQHSRIIGSDCPKQNPAQDTPQASPSRQSQGQIQSPPKSGDTNKIDNSGLLRRLKGGTTAGSSFDGDGKDIRGRLKEGTALVSPSGGDGKDFSDRLKPGTSAGNDELATVKAELATMAPDTMRNVKTSIAQRKAPPNPWSNSIVRSLKIKAPPLPEKMFSQLQPGDVLLIAPEKALTVGLWTGFYIKLFDKLSSWEWKSRASHTLIFLKEVKGVKFFLDNLPGEGPRIKTEDQIIDEYGTRTIDVAQPVSKVDGNKLWTAARELGIKQITADLKKAGNLIDTTNYGLYGDDNLVCSEASRFALIKAGLQIADTESPFKKLMGIYFGPANFYSDEQHFLVTPLARLPKINDKR